MSICRKILNLKGRPEATGKIRAHHDSEHVRNRPENDKWANFKQIARKMLPLHCELPEPQSLAALSSTFFLGTDSMAWFYIRHDQKMSSRNNQGDLEPENVTNDSLACPLWGTGRCRSRSEYGRKASGEKQEQTRRAQFSLAPSELEWPSISGGWSGPAAKVERNEIP